MRRNRKKLLGIALCSIFAIALCLPTVTGVAAPKRRADMETVAAPKELTSDGWQQKGGQWYYYDSTGKMLTGWIEVEGKHYYLYGDGHCAINEVTPDGYWVDGSGAWVKSTRELIGLEIDVAPKFVNPATVPSGWGHMRTELDEMADVIEEAFQNERRLIVGGDAVEYVSKDMEPLVGLYKDSRNQNYRLELHIRFDKSSTSMAQASTYDYAVLKGLLCKISSTPDQLCDAIYSAWQEENSYQIKRTDWALCGDSFVKYEAGDGYGKFYIRETRGH